MSSFVEAAEQQSDQDELTEAFKVVRSAEADEHGQRAAEYLGNELRYQGLALHPELRLQQQSNVTTPSSALMQLEPLLDPALFAALKNNSVGSLRQLLGLGLRAGSPSPSRSTETSNGFLEHRSGRASMPTPLVATFPLFKLDAAEKLIQELQHAQGLDEEVLRLTIPNNDAEGRKRSKHSGVVLEEIGLGPLAEALTVAVLTPIAQLMYPALTGGIDSYHAFSIHVATLDSSGASSEGEAKKTAGSRDFDTLRTQEEVASSVAAAGTRTRAEPVEHRTVGDRLPQHIDVCEVSMNVCLGRKFAGSSVKFTTLNGAERHSTAAALGLGLGSGMGMGTGMGTGFGGGAGGGGTGSDALSSAAGGRAAGAAGASSSSPADLDAQWVHHEPGVAFVNLCQHHHGTDRLLEGERHSIVVRGLASQFRRAPAESFAERCALREGRAGERQRSGEQHHGSDEL